MSIGILKLVEEANPTFTITDKELDLVLLRIGSFLSIINNKKINQAKLLVTIINDIKFQQIILKLTEFDNLKSLVEIFIEKYPSLCKSKVVYTGVKQKIRKSKKHEQFNTTRKESLQHIPPCV